MAADPPIFAELVTARGVRPHGSLDSSLVDLLAHPDRDADAEVLYLDRRARARHRRARR